MSIQQTSKKAILLHKKLKGKILFGGKTHKLTDKEIQLIYTPGVAAVSHAIYTNPEQKYVLTSKANNVAIVTDGTRILGLGKIGPYAALPVMEGKAVLYRQFGGIVAFPLCLNTTDKERIVNTIEAIEPAFGAINLEDIEFPKVMEISEELEKRLDIPIFHDDRHGTSIVALAALINALKIVKKDITTVKIVIAGSGSAGYGIVKLLNHAGCRNMVVVDSQGAIYQNRDQKMNKYKNEIAEITNPDRKSGHLANVLENADVFIGVSGVKDLLKPEMIQSMNRDSIVFALTNPEPEIDPVLAMKAGAKIIATGSYKFHNRVNNALVFPYLMRSILDQKICDINLELLLSTAKAISNTIPRAKLNPNHLIPEVGDKALQKNIDSAIRKANGIHSRN